MSAVNRTNEPNGWERALIPLRRDAFREKVLSNVDRYLALSEQQSLTVGFYRRGEWYVFGNHAPDAALMYDIGSISKTVTAHLILRLVEEGRLELSRRISDYLELTGDDYPTLYELLTHTAGYGHLTPATVTVPALFRHGYARKNIYDGCTAQTVLRCLSVNRGKRGAGYSYSDFPYAILAVVAERVTGIPFADLFEDFVQNDLNMKHTVIDLPPEDRQPKAMQGRRVLRYWHWERSNPYIAGGGLVSNAGDMLTYLSLQIES